MSTSHEPGPWRVFERKLSDESQVFHLRYHIDKNRYAREVFIDCISENDAYEARDTMNAAIAKATK